MKLAIITMSWYTVSATQLWRQAPKQFWLWPFKVWHSWQHHLMKLAWKLHTNCMFFLCGKCSPTTLKYCKPNFQIQLILTWAVLNFRFATRKYHLKAFTLYFLSTNTLKYSLSRDYYGINSLVIFWSGSKNRINAYIQAI